ncbi:hypothetical protein [Mycobacterium phage Weirdo19]|uniref:Uncharacterized protein n=1 Tax=Mycobacterium phage Weirdo19 TaxID=2601610 RepID=A0A6M2YSP9_9CAUD|nr:hypothetical protein KDJ11_gp25 [Mycobacterium phage Weirdo19]QEA10793.1 hypothetical protein [Mycobacterium phage Weirdo19]
MSPPDLFAHSGLTPPGYGQQFRYLRIEHADGTVRDHPYLWFTDAELAAMTPAEVEAAKHDRDVVLWRWAEDLHHRGVPGDAVVRIVAEWIGPLGSGPPAEPGR